MSTVFGIHISILHAAFYSTQEDLESTACEQDQQIDMLLQQFDQVQKDRKMQSLVGPDIHVDINSTSQFGVIVSPLNSHIDFFGLCCRPMLSLIGENIL